MRRASLLTAIPALLVMAAAPFGCNPMDATDTHDPPARVEPAAQKALSVVSTVHAHQMVERAGERVVYHPGWSSRIEMVGPGGERSEIYRQTRPYQGARPGEVVIGFGEVALALFDPGHRISRITVETLDGRTWSIDAGGRIVPPHGRGPAATLSLAPAAAPLDHARLSLAPAERARASVSTGPEHRIAEAAGERVTYHPGWSSRIQRVDATGRSQEIYRLAGPFQGAHPTEVVIGFRDVALTVFDPTHQIIRLTAESEEGESFEADDRIRVPVPPPPPPPPPGNGGSSW